MLVYPDVQAATDWIVTAFGFRERLRVGEGHRNQLTYRDGALIVAEPSNGRQAPVDDERTHSLTVRVDDARQHCEHARASGAVIESEPADMVFGERQYNAIDPWGHHWTFTESIADKAPEEWGGKTIDLR
ncbi:MAG: Glyoxalase/bleomycin resistance protein/dioxygenase [Subtercola sp.]|nr:Glyoxalase/bleomycin resistance protein/dioxygenase [Subtercola sp.]